jgi:hypothetical protein
MGGFDGWESRSIVREVESLVVLRAAMVSVSVISRSNNTVVVEERESE